ncbi:26.5 kDa heat shock protein, mitochondrial-like [Camellia sinensis]|nr:26.5 kDa heat shock protein, mitochondrial-like [Camellia sinensis]
MMAALGRLGLKNVEQRVVCPWTTSSSCSLGRAMQKQRWGASDLMMRMLCTTNTTSTSSASASASAAGAGAGGTDTGTGVDVKKSSSSSSSSEREVGREVSLSDREGRKKFKLFPKKQRRKGLWRNTSDHGDFVPALYEFFPPGLGDALLQATQNINKLFQNLTPSGLIGRVKEHDECYKLRFNLPGLGKEALKITVEDDVLTIKGEHKEEVEEGSDDEQYLSARSFGYFIDTCIVLPEDAKVDEIKAQMKDGVLTFIIPRIEKPKKEVKEVPIH